MRRIVLIITTFFLLIVSPVLPQAERNVHFYLGGGAAVSIGDLADIASFAPLGQIGISIKPAPVSSPELELITVFRYSRYVSEDDFHGDIQFLMVGLEARLLLARPGTSGPYISIGGGYSRTKSDEYLYRRQIGPDNFNERVIPELIEHNPYISPGLGYDFGKSNGLRFYLEGRLVNVFGTRIKNLTFFPLTFGLRF
ncbi:MAG: hypothetical protein ACOYVF_10125 [Candidatus Zixiibacteriota bacterium]